MVLGRGSTNTEEAHDAGKRLRGMQSLLREVKSQVGTNRDFVGVTSQELLVLSYSVGQGRGREM